MKILRRYHNNEAHSFPMHQKKNPASILYKSIAGRYRPVRVADGPITALYRFIKNAYWEELGKNNAQCYRIVYFIADGISNVFMFVNCFL